MLYFLECLILPFLSIHSGNRKPMYTTGQPPTMKEVWICVVAYIIIFLLIIFIIVLTKSYKKKNYMKKGSIEYDECLKIQDKKIKSSKFYKKLSYFLECMALGILSLNGGMNRTMYTTGAKPSKKEILICSIGWLTIIIIVVSVILLCIYL